MVKFRHADRQRKRLIQCYQKVNIAQTHIEELCNDNAEKLADVVGLVSIPDENANDVDYLHAVAVSRCILLQKEGAESTQFKTEGGNVYKKAVYYAERLKGSSGWKEYSLLNKCKMESVARTKSLVVAIRNPGIFLQSKTFLNICKIVGDDLMLNILLSYRMFVPEYIYGACRDTQCAWNLSGEEDQDYVGHVCGIIKDTIRTMDAPRNKSTELNGGTKPFIFIQCSGTVMYDGNIRDLPGERNWSSITLSRHLMLYRDSFNHKFGFAKCDLFGAAISLFSSSNNKGKCYTAQSLRHNDATRGNSALSNIHSNGEACMSDANHRTRVLYESPETERLNDMTAWKLLQLVIFDRNFMNASFVERRKATDLFIESIMDPPPKPVNWRRRSMIYGVYQLFRVLLKNLVKLDIRKVYRSMFCNGKATRFSTIEKSIDPNIVVGFVHHIVDKVVPHDLLGCFRNFRRLKDVCRSIVVLNKGENLDMSQIMKGFKARSCAWSKTSEGRLTKGQTVIILGYMCRIVFLILEHLVIPLLQRHFYITETNFTMYRLMYFRKSDWYRMVMSENTSYLSNVGFIQAAKQPAKRSKESPVDVGSSCANNVNIKGIRVRWVPKLIGMRPIMNCSSGSTRKSGCSKICSYNDMMEMPFYALTANIRLNPRLLGNGILGYTGAFRSLKRWWERFLRICKDKRRVTNTLRLHIILADVSRCYDNIPHKLLLKALDKLTLHGTLLFKRIYRRDLIKVASFSNSYSRRVTVLLKDKRLSVPIETGNIISRSIGQFSICSRHANDYFSKRVSRADILVGVRDFLSHFQITLPKISSQVYMKRTMGIPQGCCISPLLCSIFLAQGDMNPSVQRLTNASRGNLLLRWIDDFIFISPNEEDVADMMKILENNSVFGVELNDKCSVMHLDIPLRSNSITGCHGSLRMGSVRPSHNIYDYANPYMGSIPPRRGMQTSIGMGKCLPMFTNEHQELVWINSTFEFDILGGRLNASLKPWKNYHTTIRDSLNLSRLKSSSFMFAFLEQRLLGYLSNRLQHGLFTNSQLNGARCILQNSYIVMRICTMKMTCAALALIKHFGGFINCRYFGRLSHKLVDHACRMVSRGGLNIEPLRLRRVLQLAVIYTFNPQWLGRFKRSYGKRRIRFICYMERKLKEQWPLQGCNFSL